MLVVLVVPRVPLPLSPLSRQSKRFVCVYSKTQTQTHTATHRQIHTYTHTEKVREIETMSSF